jgi:lipopolysaccharide export system permease protein
MKRMPHIERYVLRRATYAFLLTLGALLGAVWTTQVMRDLDVVTAQGQAIWVFLVMTLLALPALFQVVAPIAFLVAVVVTLNSLTADSELPVISAAGASRKAVNRPILTLGAIVTIAVALSHHIISPVSLSTLRALLTRVRADVISTLVQDGGFRSVDDGLTMHIREKAADGSFLDIFVNDDRDPDESLQYTAARGTLIERVGGSFLVLQDGHLIRDNRLKNQKNVVDFDTYALDLSQLGAPGAAAIYKARERSTLYLLDPATNDPFANEYPERVSAELHARMTAPLYTIAFALICLAFLGRPRTSRQDRNFAICAAVVFCLLLRAAGFAAMTAANVSRSGIALLYAIPLAGIGFGWLAMQRNARMRIPAPLESAWDSVAEVGERAARRVLPRVRGAGADR